MEQATIDAQQRTALGKKNRALRRSGITPIHIYGMGQESLSLQTNTYDLVRTILDVGYTTPLTVKVGKDEHFVMVGEVQRHPVNGTLVHVDMFRVSRTERRHASVPVHLDGEAPAARDEGAMLSHDLYNLDVEALPTDLPSALTVDVSGMEEEDAVIHASDVTLPANVTLVTEPEAVVVRIVHRRVAEEVEEEAAAEAEGADEATEAPAAEQGGGEAEEEAAEE